MELNNIQAHTDKIIELREELDAVKILEDANEEMIDETMKQLQHCKKVKSELYLRWKKARKELNRILDMLDQDITDQA